VIVRMGRRVDFKSRSQLMVALQTETFVVALQGRLGRRPRVESRGLATDLLLAILAGTSDECLRLAGLVLLAGIRGVALLCASVLARFADFTTWLQAVCPGDPYVFALPGSVAVFLALMSAALERLAARQATSGLFEPARLVLQDLLSTNARLLHQKGALWARYIIRVTLVLNTGMSASASPVALKPALRWPAAAGLWRGEDGTPASATDLVENGFGARRAWTPMAQLLASVVAALELTSAHLDADVFSLVVFIDSSTLLLSSLSSLFLSRAAPLSALVSTTVELSLANAEAQGMLDGSLVTNRLGCRSSTPAGHIDDLGAETTRARVAPLFARVTARKNLVARLLAVWYRILARLSRLCW